MGKVTLADAPVVLEGASAQAIAARRWPRLWAACEAAASQQPAARREAAPQPTLVFDGIHLTSAYDRPGEAALQARLIPTHSAEAWVYGPALGDLPRLLLRRPALQRLNVVVLHPGVFWHALQLDAAGDWLADERVALLDGAEQSEVRHPFAASPACLRLACPACSRLRDLLWLELATPFIHYQLAHDEHLAARLAQNRRLIENDGDVSELFGSRKGATAWVAAAGPTLYENLGRLGARRPADLVIAVDAALRPLLNAGVQPDVVVTVDEGEKVIPLLQIEHPAPPPLVYFPGVQPAALQSWRGARLAAYPANSVRFAILSAGLPRGCLFSGGSVLHSAADLAVRMGAERVILLGADFSFPGGHSHAPGVPHGGLISPQDDYPHVLDGNGAPVATKPNLRNYLRELERYIAAHREVRWVNGSRAGARIAGTEYFDA